MTPDQRLEENQRVSALAAAGIPREFHGKQCSLEPYNDREGVPPLRLLLQGAVPSTWAGGKVFLVNDESQQHGARVTYLIARALALRGFSVMARTLPVFMGLLEEGKLRATRDGDPWDRDLDVLALLGFVNYDGPRGDGAMDVPPFIKRDAERLEWLLDSMLSNGKNLVLHSRANMDVWWSQRFCLRVRECTVAEVTV